MPNNTLKTCPRLAGSLFSQFATVMKRILAHTLPPRRVAGVA